MRSCSMGLIAMLLGALLAVEAQTSQAVTFRPGDHGYQMSNDKDAGATTVVNLDLSIQ